MSAWIAVAAFIASSVAFLVVLRRVLATDVRRRLPPRDLFAGCAVWQGSVCAFLVVMRAYLDAAPVGLMAAAMAGAWGVSRRHGWLGKPPEPPEAGTP